MLYRWRGIDENPSHHYSNDAEGVLFLVAFDRFWVDNLLVLVICCLPLRYHMGLK
jgi:hypothetical protein